MEQIQFIQTSPEELAEKIRLVVREELSSDIGKKESTLKYFSRQEVASLLKITLPTLAEYTQAGIIKGCRLGRRVLYSEDSVRDAVKEIPIQKFRRNR